MLIKIGELTVDKQKDYHGEVVKCLEDAGFTLIKTSETFGQYFYDIAKGDKNE